MSKFTPGPWKIDGPMIVPESAVKSEMGYQSGEYIAQHFNTLGKTQKANARLIAAAPDLLAALRAIVARINGVWDDLDLMSFGELLPDTEADIEIIASQAIAKAKGPPC